jgi:ABC-type amino acid transport system permease subunit
MSPDSPYLPPMTKVAGLDRPATRRSAVLRVLAWTLLIWVTSSALAFASGLTMARWDWYGPTMQEATEMARLVRRTVIGLTVFGLYVQFLRGTPRHLAAHAAILFVTCEGLSAVMSWTLFGGDLLDIDKVVLVRNATACALALAAVAVMRARVQRTQGGA